MHRRLIPVLAFFTLAGACGGRFVSEPGAGDGGTSSDSSPSGDASSSGSGDDSSDGSDDGDCSPSCPPPECPSGIPYNGLSCSYEGQSCDYGQQQGGCNFTCSCQPITGGEAGSLWWQCHPDPCPFPTCPDVPPQNGAPCAVVDTYCYYPADAGCFSEMCECDPSSMWWCTDGGGAGGSCDGSVPPPDAGGLE